MAFLRKLFRIIWPSDTSTSSAQTDESERDADELRQKKAGVKELIDSDQPVPPRSGKAASDRMGSGNETGDSQQHSGDSEQSTAADASPDTSVPIDEIYDAVDTEQPFSEWAKSYPKSDAATAVAMAFIRSWRQVQSVATEFGFTIEPVQCVSDSPEETLRRATHSSLAKISSNISA